MTVLVADPVVSSRHYSCFCRHCRQCTSSSSSSFPASASSSSLPPPSSSSSSSCLSLPKSYDKPLRFNLKHDRPSKTVDVGRNGVSVSLEPLGSILQLSTFHPHHGIVLASPYEQFDGTRFRDPQYVRRYRRKMLESVRNGTPGFGMRFFNQAEAGPEHVVIDFQTASLATVSFEIPGAADSRGSVSVVLSVMVKDNGEVVQTAVVTSSPSPSSTGIDDPAVLRIGYTLGLGISVNRASYGQLTEGGPIPIPKSENRLKTHGGGRSFSVTNPHLEAHLEGWLEVDGVPVNLADDVQEQVTRDSPIKATSQHWLDIPSGSQRVVVARFKLFPDTDIRHSGEGPGVAAATTATTWSGSGGHLRAGIMRQVWRKGNFVIRRNLEYILGCLAVPVSEEHVALITDHVALPLGWNRDNYWQIRFLHTVRRSLPALVLPEVVHQYGQAIDHTIRGHLLWVFQRARRPHGYWHRSYLVNGKPKDGPTFQLDQQCYPLLELCDFYDSYPEHMALVRKIAGGGVPAAIVELLWARRDAGTGLFPTDETPGDDRVEYPFHFSSNVLLWYTLSRMAQLLSLLERQPDGGGHVDGMVTDSNSSSPESVTINPKILQSRARDLRAATLRHFVTRRPGSGGGKEEKGGDHPLLFAYLCDGKGRHQLYHDANDIPTLMAAKWDFTGATRELGIWKNTMDWATSPENTLGYFGKPGEDRFAGLGSVHTPGPWPLGYFQELVYADMTGDMDAMRDAWRRLQSTMFFDGTFCEAVDAPTGTCISKAWFNWPGCMISSYLLERMAVHGGEEGGV